jgi:hypothetical protein
MSDTESTHLDSQRGRVVAEWIPMNARGAYWKARTYVMGDETTVKETKHGGREPRLAAKRAAIRRMKRIAAGGDPVGRGWGGQRAQHASKAEPTVAMRALVPVDVAARLVAEAREAGISDAVHLGRVLQEARR